MSAEQRHIYRAVVRWTGNRGIGTGAYTAYGRDHVFGAPGKPPVAGSADPAFRGDDNRYNPEELLVASLSACHMLWYLHLCAEADVTVTAYEDAAEGVMETDGNGGGRFTSVTLCPRVTVTPHSDPERARALHEGAHARCFIANSVNFPVSCAPELSVS